MSRGNLLGRSGGRYKRSFERLEQHRRASLGYAQREKKRRRSERAHRERQTADVDPLLEQARRGQLPLLEGIFTPERLFHLIEKCQREKGQAPGIDGLRWENFSESKKWELCRKACRVVREGRYGPQPARNCEIPKANGKTRTLKLRVILDRLIATAVAEILAVYLDPSFEPCSYAYRPGKSVCGMLAAIDEAVSRGRYVLSKCDVKGAFDNVPIDPLLNIVRKRVPDASCQDLIETIARGGDRHAIGIDQGSPLSPVLLNLFLDEILDKPLRKDRQPKQTQTHTRNLRQPRTCPTTTDDPDTGFSDQISLRYADDIITPSCSERTARRNLKRIAALLQSHGMEFKDTDNPAITDLRKDSMEVLGFQVSAAEGALSITISGGAWNGLKEGLKQAHSAADPPADAKHRIEGWINAYGPALNPEQDDNLFQLIQVLQDTGFDGLYLENDARRLLENAWEAWCNILRSHLPNADQGPLGPDCMTERQNGTPCPTTAVPGQNATAPPCLFDRAASRRSRPTPSPIRRLVFGNSYFSPVDVEFSVTESRFGRSCLAVKFGPSCGTVLRARDGPPVRAGPECKDLRNLIFENLRTN